MSSRLRTSTFGQVNVTVNLDRKDCVIVAKHKARGAVTEAEKRTHYHSLDEIIGAYSAQNSLKTLLAENTARALKFAGGLIREQYRKEGRHA